MPLKVFLPRSLMTHFLLNPVNTFEFLFNYLTFQKHLALLMITLFWKQGHPLALKTLCCCVFRVSEGRLCGLSSDTDQLHVLGKPLTISGIQFPHNSQLLSHVQLLPTPQTATRQAPMSMEFSRQEYQCGQPCPSPGNLSNPGIKPMGDLYCLSCPESPSFLIVKNNNRTYLLGQV